MKKFLNWFTKEESGQGMVEYGLILALIAVVVIGAVTAIGLALRGKFQSINEKLA